MECKRSIRLLRQLVAGGRISQEEALAHAANPEALRMAFQGVILSETRGIIGHLIISSCSTKTIRRTTTCDSRLKRHERTSTIRLPLAHPLSHEKHPINS
jgi:hypothetical protein